MRRIAVSAGVAIVLVAAATLLFGGRGGHAGTKDDGVFVPASDAAIVERLRTRPLDGADREYRLLRARLREAPQDPQLATAAAMAAIQIARRDGDPRYLGRAEAALAPWWSLEAPPPGIALLKATLLQSNHQFDAALEMLDAVLAREPQNAQAWLTRAAIEQVQGKWSVAAASCRRVGAAGAELYARACLADLAGLSGATRPAALVLQRLADGAPAQDRAWIDLLRADLAERTGDARAAEQAYRRVLSVESDVFAKAAYADFLLDAGRPAEVVALLERDQRADPLLLRLAIAYRALNRSEATDAIAALDARFAAARLRGDTLHRREEARFELELRDRPEQALELARANWAQQKELSDARILLAAAHAAGQPAAAAPVLEFLKDRRVVDRRLERGT